MGNIEIPKSVDGWTLPVIEQLVDLDCYETDTYDFKGYLKAEKESREKYNQRLRKTTCAFANSNGGFVVFGVTDRDSDKHGRDRIVGIEKGDLARYFGDIIRTVEPGVVYFPQNPPVAISNGARFLFVVHIPKSLRLPHAVLEDSNYVFYKRTNTGNAHMSFSEIESAFAQKIGIMSKFILLRTTLVSLKNGLAAYNVIDLNTSNKFPITTPDYSMINLVIADLYPVLANDQQLFLLLSALSESCGILSAHVNQLCMTIIINKNWAIQQYNEYIVEARSRIESLIREVMNILEKKYSIKDDPLSRLIQIEEDFKQKK